MDIENQPQAYVTNARANGSQDGQIREALIAAGYPPNTVERALVQQATAPNATAQQQRDPKKKRLVTVIMVTCGVLFIMTVISLMVVVTNQQDKPTKTIQTLPANLTKESISFDGQTFSFNHPKNWISNNDALTDADRNFQTADFTLYNSTDGSGDHGLIQRGASFEMHVGKYGTGGISAFKHDLEDDQQKGFYKPLSVAENIAQTTIKGKPAITYTESTDHRQVVVIFFGTVYAVQLSNLRPYTETPDKGVTVDTTYQNAFYDLVGSFTMK